MDDDIGRAFLVGAPYGGLKGTEHDVRSMAEMLGKRGFAVERCCGTEATRDGIIDGYQRLIDQVGESQAAVFYYSGHGFWGFEENESASWQGITPVDIDASTRTDFRGITAWELSANQARLTARTKNVTVILDCCHAALMSRDAAFHQGMCKVVPHPIRAGFKAHLREVKAKYGVAVDAVGPTGNQDSVRLVACGQDESAYVYRADDGTYRSIFTEKLLEVLGEVGDVPVSWAAIEEAIRGRVRARYPTQRPVIEGPALRRLFSTREHEAGGALTIIARPNGLELSGGRLMGVQPGDVYYVMPPGPPTYRPADAIAEVCVRESSATSATADLRTWRNCHKALPQDSIAVPARTTRVRYPVRIDVRDAAHETAKTQIEVQVQAAPILRLLELGDERPLATLRLSGSKLTIEDPLGPLYPAREFPDGLPDTVKNLANLAAAEELRKLAGEHGVLADNLEIEWGTVVEGEMQRMADHGAALGLGDRLYVKIRSQAERTLYAHVFNVGVRGKIELLTAFAPAGAALTRQQPELVLGELPDRTLVGLELCWPPGLPRETFPRMDELVVIVTSKEANLRGYETRELLGEERGADAKPRGVESSDGFLCKRLTYLLHPRDAAMASPPFEIELDPAGQVAAQTVDAWLDPRETPPRPPSTISIRIAQLVVQDSERFSGRLRVDALICTRSTGAGDGYATWTHRCHGDGDHQGPLIENQIVFDGPVMDFVEICLWVSRDTANSLDLGAKLLEHRTRSIELSDAASMLRMSTDALEVPWIAATGASAVLARVAYNLLGREGAATGMFHNAFLTRKLVVGLPVEEVHRSANFALSLELRPYGEVP